jgi:hypothetical protein
MKLLDLALNAAFNKNIIQWIHDMTTENIKHVTQRPGLGFRV